MKLAFAVLFLSASVGVACKPSQLTCGKGTHEESGTCVADKVAEPAKPSTPAAEPKTEAKPVEQKPAVKTGPISLAIVMNGWEVFVGNDKEVPSLAKDDPSRYSGVLLALRAALDKHKIGTWGPAGSQAMVITYADKPVIRVPMSPLAGMTGSSLGTQQDYFGTTGVELVSAIRLAMAELRKSTTARRVLIVVSDGNDTNNDAAKSQLEDLKKQATQDDVQAFAIIFKSQLSADTNVLSSMIPDAKQIADAKEIDAAIASIAAKL